MNLCNAGRSFHLNLMTPPSGSALNNSKVILIMTRTFRSLILTGTLFAFSAPALADGGGGEQPENKKDMDMQHAHEHEHNESYWFGHPGDPSRVTRTIKIIAIDIKFEPADLTVKVGETIRFEVTNTGKLEHEFVLGDQASQEEHEMEMQDMMRKMPGVSMTHSDPNTISVKSGETKTLIWRFTKPGKLQYGCHVPGHFPAGMVGQLTVR